ncbi:MAG: ankyrin repeat domain-containing protein [Planctomycetota bacterium]
MIRFGVSQSMAIWIIVALSIFSSYTTYASDEFLAAIQVGNLDHVKQLASENPNLVTRVGDGASPLATAVANNHLNVARWLLEHGADAEVNLRTGQSGSTPIFDARTGSMATLLLESGADPLLKSEWSSTPMREALRNNHVGVVKVLVEAGVPLDFENAVALEDIPEVTKQLRLRPWLAKPPKKPLLDAARLGNRELTKLLLQHGADPDIDLGASNVRGPFTALTYAVQNDHFDVAELLLDNGASPNVSGGRNHSNLFLYAIAYRDARFTTLMLRHGVDLQKGDGWNKGITPLHVAASLGGSRQTRRVGRVGQPASLDANRSQGMEKVRALITAGADVNARAKDQSTPLLQAAIAGNRDVCSLLLQHGAELDIASACLLGKRNAFIKLYQAREASQQTDLAMAQPLLHWAVLVNDVDSVRRLLRQGANPDATAPELSHQDASGYDADERSSSNGPSALHLAARGGFNEIINLLLDHGADINKRADSGYRESALAMALVCDHTLTVELLLKRGAKANWDDGSSFQWTTIADAKTLERLLDSANIDCTQPRGTTLLENAIEDENLAAIELLKSRGAKLDLIAACRLGALEDVRRILGEEAGQHRAQSASLIATAVQTGNADVLRLLIEHGLPLTAPEAYENTTLIHTAASEGHLDVLKLLARQREFSLNHTCRYGTTLLHAAASGNQPEITRYLISKGADVNARDFDGQNPLHHIRGLSWGDEETRFREVARRASETVRLLIEAGADVSARDNNERTPLHQAVLGRLEDAASLLISHGAEVNSRDWRNATPMTYAYPRYETMSGFGLTAIRELLQAHGGVK